jgi:hypothetical protein
MGEQEAKAKFDALYIDPTAMKKIQYWTDAADGEVSGLGIVENEDGKYVVKDAYILDQKCSSADTELEPEAISKLMTDIIKDGKDPARLKFWWHSHVNMSTFWSGTDDECAETLSKEFAFSLVVNKSKDKRCRLDLYDPFRITVDHIKVLELTPDDEDLKKKCEDDVKDKVKSHTTYYRGNDYYSGGYFRGGHHKEDPYHGYGGWPHDVDEWNDRPKNWGKRIKLPMEDVNEVERLGDAIYRLGLTPETIHDYIKDVMTDVIKETYEGKAACRDGAGTYDVEEKLCQECKIANICERLTNKFGPKVEYIEADEVENVQDVEVIVDGDKTGGKKDD